jgi:head-tail adaptor
VETFAMRAGRLDRRVAVQRLTTWLSGSGEPLEVWATIGGIARWASKSPVTGLERFGSQQLEAKEQLEFRLRWTGDLADLQPADRLIEPADDALAPTIPSRSIYDIIAVLEINRREGLRVLTTRRLATPTAGGSLSDPRLVPEDDSGGALITEDGSGLLIPEGP